MAAMKCVGGVLAGLAVVALLAACGTSVAPPVKFSPTPTAKLAGAKLQVVNQSWRRGHELIFTGTGFNPSVPTTAEIVQQGRSYNLGAVTVNQNGRLAAVFTVPMGLDTGVATLMVCSQGAASGCVSQNISIAA